MCSSDHPIVCPGFIRIFVCLFETKKLFFNFLVKNLQKKLTTFRSPDLHARRKTGKNSVLNKNKIKIIYFFENTKNEKKTQIWTKTGKLNKENFAKNENKVRKVKKKTKY